MHSQVAADTKPAFDVASIKPSAPDARAGLVIQPGGHLIASGFSLKALTGFAYHITTAFQISGGDGWLANDRWNIEAKAADVPNIPAWEPPEIPEVIAVRLRALLEDRFFLKVHRETREVKAYTLILGKSGSKLVAVDPSQQPIPGQQDARTTQSRTPARGGSSAEPTPAPGRMMAGPGVIVASAVPMSQLVNYLNRIMDLPVIDKTGLIGRYDIKLRFAPESTRQVLAIQSADGSRSVPPTSGDPSIFTEIQEQLGLSLKLAKEPVEVLVIDSARRPTEN